MAQTPKGPRLELRTKADISLTPQLRQAIKMLQMNNLEISEFIESNIEDNPLAEKAEKTETSTMDSDISTGSDEYIDSYDGLYKNLEEGSLKDSALDTYYSNSFESESVWRETERRGDFPSGNMIENTSNSKSIYEIINDQIGEEFTNAQEIMLANELSSCLDANGWLDKDSAEEVIKRLGCSQSFFEKVLEKMQNFEPTGIFARSLKECLSIQLKSAGKFDDIFKKIFEKLDWLSSGKLLELAKHCQISQEKLAEYLAALKKLDPRPADQAIDYTEPASRIPDLIVRKIGDDFVVIPNHQSHHQIRLNKSLYAKLKGSKLNKDEKSYVKGCWYNANWLHRALEQRQDTILLTGKAIVKRQQAFFEHGILSMRPLVLRQIAEDTELHESTISRVTTGKYLICDRGIFELKFFFQSSISNELGFDHSSGAVREMIAKLISEEDKTLSDEMIEKELKKEGVEIARRTIAKYRELMKIPSSAVRKRLAKAGKKIKIQ